ncbi:MULTISPECIES: hypothetical protein [unclassified Micromonospora]|uniref:hypothetical protein n=1 Tax=unclassified Micromonospora TaxID=2617518 RepID=UPI0003EEC6F6|nr:MULTISPECIES: hypothetical protein [unclassified Micromonospora]EWM68215.1 vegetative cell wall protein gp1 [Micromonospora sp. M42]MCK1806447.1 hypothetical protein [Micromonospora sp. R42106]MCK1831920.1 hypothetical protein [Micromonospora sp. R42003]MCK1843387.1 hypothetical protein [Micromonospora sp. R42004]MCM1017412.1 hypothetical protein [Micromonospora sp. XM-20-01]
MSDPFEGLLRSTLTDIAEEAPTVRDSLTRAERRARSRRRNTVAAGAAGVLAVLVISAPFAYAGRGDDAVISPQPGTSVPQPSRSEPVDPSDPVAPSPVPVSPEDPSNPVAPSPVPIDPDDPSNPVAPSPVPIGPRDPSNPAVRPDDAVVPSPSPTRR